MSMEKRGVTGDENYAKAEKPDPAKTASDSEPKTQCGTDVFSKVSEAASTTTSPQGGRQKSH